MAQNARPKPVAHIYAFAAVWLLFALVGISFNGAFDVVMMTILASGVSGIVFFISSITGRRKRRPDIVETLMPEQKPEPVATTGSPEVDAVVDEADVLLSELNAAKQKIRNREIVSKTDEIADISNKIVEKLKRDPQLLSSAKRFFNHYLPTTTKLITNYSYMEAQGVSGGHISETMQKIETTLDTLVNAYRAQLDTLFSKAALDLKTDIDVLESVLQTEGLTQKTLQNEQLDNVTLDVEADIKAMEESLAQDGLIQK
ncbi:MAG: 5-bromo-4-chloroindolyl phosphate hydrolysis family protein [Oscillospiraceae bacterium]|nr:5-bromo-4-chloroindolyl phosphate hydrolysis family protein [Oscillospiraceae bacterium]